MFCVAESPVADVNSVIKAVIKHGNDRWYDIGLKLGLSNAQVNTTANDKPSGDGKLLALIERKKEEVGVQCLAQDLLRACKDISSPIIGAVEDELQNSSFS